MNKIIKPCVVMITIIIIAIILDGCGWSFGLKSSSSEKIMSASFKDFIETKTKSIELTTGDEITFKYEIKLEEGNLSALLEDSSGNIICDFELNINDQNNIMIEQDDTYHIVIKGDNATGSYKFEWKIE